MADVLNTELTTMNEGDGVAALLGDIKTLAMEMKAQFGDFGKTLRDDLKKQ